MITEELKDYNNTVSCFRDRDIQVDYENIPVEMELSYTYITAAQLNSNRSPIANLQDSLNLVRGAIFIYIKNI